MKAYYSHKGIELYHGDCREILPIIRRPEDVVITDPPFNVGYHYQGYSDRLAESEYKSLLAVSLCKPCVLIHYPEDTFKIAAWLEVIPDKCVAWTYNANTPRQWRMCSWFGHKPDFSLVKQPYRNPTDRRVAALMESGSEGCPLYDWWHDEQVRNVSSDKTSHPCQMPIGIMKKVCGVTVTSGRVLDPFCGSGTTLLAVKELGLQGGAVGIELEEKYCEIIATRLSQDVLF